MEKNKLRFFKKKRNKNQTPLIVDAFNFKDVKIKEEWRSSRKNFKLKLTIKNFSLITLGALLASLAFYYFVNPANLYTNGLSGIAQLISKIIFLPFEYTDPDYFNQMRALWFYPILFVMNIPIIIWSVFKIGIRFSLYTTIYMGLNIAFLTMFSLTPGLKDFQVLNSLKDVDVLAKSFIFAGLAGLITGSGYGLLFLAGGSTGGMDFFSVYISMKRRYSVANIIKNTNIVIVIFAVFIDGVVLHQRSVPDTYFSDPFFFATIVYIYITAFAMNRVYPKFMMMTIFIISSEIEKIREYIYANNYLRGGNIWDVKGLYSGKEYNMMMTTMSLLEYNFFKQKIADIDPNLFMIAVPTRNMYGGSAGNFPKKGPVDISEIASIPPDPKKD